MKVNNKSVTLTDSEVLALAKHITFNSAMTKEEDNAVACLKEAARIIRAYQKDIAK